MEPLFEITSHVDGKNAKVRVYADRVEWEKAGRMTMTRLATGAITLGASLLATGARQAGGTETVFMRQITGVRTSRASALNHAVHIITAGNEVQVRCSKREADQLADAIRAGIAAL